MADDSDAPIHQLLFGWVRGAQGAEMGVLASSYPDGSSSPGQWWHRLRRYVRLLPSRTDTGPLLPDTTLTYLTFPGGEAALLRRTSIAESAGRNMSHALVGPATALGPIALHLDAWPLWFDRTGSRHLNPIRTTELAASLESTTSQDQPDPQWTQAVQGHLNRHPDRSVTVIGLEQRYVLPLLAELVDPADGGRYRGTFSTYEVNDTDTPSDQPDIVFVPVLPVAGTTERSRVFPLRPAADPPPRGSTVREAVDRLPRRNVAIDVGERGTGYDDDADDESVAWTHAIHDEHDRPPRNDDTSRPIPRTRSSTSPTAHWPEADGRRDRSHQAAIRARELRKRLALVSVAVAGVLLLTGFTLGRVLPSGEGAPPPPRTIVETVTPAPNCAVVPLPHGVQRR